MAKEIRQKVIDDLAELGKGAKDGDRITLNSSFFTHPNSRIELVGIVNRIDRQFIKDKVAGSEGLASEGDTTALWYRGVAFIRAGAIEQGLSELESAAAASTRGKERKGAAP